MEVKFKRGESKDDYQHDLDDDFHGYFSMHDRLSRTGDFRVGYFGTTGRCDVDLIIKVEYVS